MDPIIQIRGLSKVFEGAEGRISALENVDLTVEKGDIYGIIGLSGAGKSTLVRCINLLERPTAGTVVVNGVEMNRLKKRRLLAARGFHRHDLPELQPAGTAHGAEKRLLSPGDQKDETGRRGTARRERWKSWGCPNGRTPTRRNFPAGRNSAWRSEMRLSAIQGRF